MKHDITHQVYKKRMMFLQKLFAGPYKLKNSRLFLFGVFSILSISCGGGGGGGTSPGGATNTRPSISSFNANPVTTNTSTPVTFSWSISDTDADALTCELDVNGDGSNDYSISNCTNSSSQSHTFSSVGNYTAQLSVSDGKGGSVQQSVAITIDNGVSPPVINSFTVAPEPGYTNSSSTFSWNVSDANGDTLTCSLDVNNDGSIDYTINDCANTTTKDHVYLSENIYTANLIVSDGKGGSDQKLLTPITILNPLSVNVSVTQQPAVASKRLVYTITLANPSSGSIDGINVKYTVPTGLNFHEFFDAEPDTSSGCSSCLPGGEAIWNIGTLVSGESRTITINTNVIAGTPDGTVMTAPILVTATGISNINADKTVSVYNSPSAELVASASTDPVVPGQTFTYNVDVGNIGAGTLTTLQMRTLLPAGVSVVSISDGGTEVNPGEIVWSVGSLGVTRGLHREVTVTANSTLVAGTILATTTQLTYDGGLAVDNIAEHVVTVVDTALPLKVDISMATGIVATAKRLTYSVTLSNPTTLPIDAINLLLRVPAGINFHEFFNVEPDLTSGCSSCLPGGEAKWDIGTLAAGETRTITVNAYVIPTTPDGSLIPTSFRLTSSGQRDTIDLLKVASVYSVPAAELITSVSTDPVEPGQTFTYNLDVGNIGAGTLTSLQMRTVLPTGVSVVSISDGGTEIRPGEIIWNAGSLGVANALHREVTVTADSNLVAGTILATDTHLRHAGGLDLDNTAEHVVTVVDTALPLKVDISMATSPVAKGKRLTYNVTLSNPTALPVDAINLLLRVPAGINFHEFFDAEPDLTSGCSSCLPSHEAKWDIGTLAAGETRTITINANVIAATPDGSLIPTSFRLTSSGQRDTIDLLKVASVYSVPEAELITSASTDPVVPGETFTYKVDVGNFGAGTLTTLQLRTLLPAGVSVVSISNGGTEVSPGEIIWNVGSLGVANALHREVTVTADSNLVAGTILATDTQLTHDGDLEIDNFGEHVVTVVDTPLPLSLDVTATPNPVVSGAGLLFTITVTNNSALPADAVDLVFRVPAEINFHQILEAEPDVSSGCGGACFPGHEARWSLGTLAAGESRVITVDSNVAVGPPPGGSLIGSSFRLISAGQPDTIDRVFVVPVQ